MAVCAFTKIALNDTFKADYPFDSDIEARYVYLQDDDEELLLGAFDVSRLHRWTNRDIREAIAEGTGVPVQRVLLHEHQMHSAPGGNQLVGEPARRIAEKSIAALKPAIASARECEVAWAVTDVGDEFSHVREQYIPDLGCVTSWGIYELDEDGRAHQEDCQHFLLGDWRPDVPALKEPVYFDRPNDPLVPLLVFRTPDGEVLGSILRFAAHVHVVNWRQPEARQPGMDRDYRYSWDFPGYACERLEERLGGMGMYLNGPCADLTPKMRVGMCFDDGRSEAQRIGRGLVDAALSSFDRAPPSFEPVRLEGSANRTVDLPMRDTVPRSREELKAFPARIEAARKELDRLIQDGAWPTRIKRQVDDVYHLQVMEAKLDRVADEELTRGMLRVDVEGFGLNGLVFVGFPGETLTDTGQWVRAQTLGERVVTVDQVGGHNRYLVTRERFALGGYAYWNSVLSRDAEPLLRKAGVDVVREVCLARGTR